MELLLLSVFLFLSIIIIRSISCVFAIPIGYCSQNVQNLQKILRRVSMANRERLSHKCYIVLSFMVARGSHRNNERQVANSLN